MQAEFILGGWKCNETKLREEYCRAITQTARWSCCHQSGSIVLDFWISAGQHCVKRKFLTICTVSSDLAKFDLRRTSRKVIIA